MPCTKPSECSPHVHGTPLLAEFMAEQWLYVMHMHLKHYTFHLCGELDSHVSLPLDKYPAHSRTRRQPQFEELRSRKTHKVTTGARAQHELCASLMQLSSLLGAIPKFRGRGATPAYSWQC
eukprot:3180662-Amphidinium_carterae.1